MNYGPADALMHAWLEQVIRRQKGETTDVRAISFALSGNVSACCGFTPTTTREGDWKCPECKQRCEIRSWVAPRDEAGRGDWRHIHVAETRTVNRGRQDAQRALEADRFVWLQRIVEPRPRESTETAWHCCLAAYGLLLLQGTVSAGSEEESVRFDALAAAGFGERTSWTTWSHRQNVRHARSVVAQRAKRRRLDCAGGWGAQLMQRAM
jgi:hypothetical protein